MRISDWSSYVCSSDLRMEPRDDGAEIGPLPRADDAGAAGASVGARPRFAWGFARGREMSALLALLLGGAAAPAPATIVIDEAATVREEAPPPDRTTVG